MTDSAPSGLGPGTPLAELELAPVVRLRSDAMLLEVAQIMTRSGTSAVVIGAGTAILTERDLVWAMARGRAPTTPAIDAATTHPWMIRDTDTAVDALAAMVRHEVRHLVVVDALDRIVGLIALARAAEVVLGHSEVPHWLSALRLALRVDVRAPGGPGDRRTDVAT